MKMINSFILIFRTYWVLTIGGATGRAGYAAALPDRPDNPL